MNPFIAPPLMSVSAAGRLWGPPLNTSIEV